MKKFSKLNEGQQWASSNRIVNNPPFQEVQVYISIHGDYCAFHEISFRVAYDVTNDTRLSTDMSLEELQNYEYEGYSDYKLARALKIGKKYYVDFSSI